MSTEAVESDKKKTIADAAFQVFAEHGFRKTSMQLIAEKAGMSRPALYLHFQSKEDVFGYLAIGYLTFVRTHIQETLDQSGPPAQVLLDVFEAFDPDGFKEILLDAEHGHELMEVKTGLAKDFGEKTAIDIRAALCTWLAREAKTGTIDCDDPQATAETILSAYNGLIDPRPNYAEYKQRRKKLAELFGKALKP